MTQKQTQKFQNKEGGTNPPLKAYQANSLNEIENMKNFLKEINANYFFENYVEIKNWKHKLRGTDGNGKPIEFNKDEKRQIKAGLKKMFADCIKSIGAQRKSIADVTAFNN